MPLTRCVALAFAFATTLAFAPDAFAAKPAPADDPAALYARGEAAYEAERYDDALAAFSKSYELSKEPALLFNVGQCHRKLAHHAEAVTYLERYLNETSDVSNRAEVEAILVEERALADEEKRAAAAAAAPPPETAPPPATESETDNPLGEPVIWAVGIGAAAAVVTGTVIVAALLWPQPEPESGSLGTVDLRGGN